ncbi:MAG: flavodoxin family protein [Treponema sp.]|jgi:multimeric flavodoxin WrbA|nr:flavodoxin family protein [Treponema sp.]
MKIIGINGSPRKGWNTHTLVAEALKGAGEGGAETELVNLYDLRFTGCISCFACKLQGGPGLGHCAVQDGLKPLLENIEAADGLVIGSPIYWGEATASTRAFLERFLFQYLAYGKERNALLQKRIKTAFIFTGNVPADHLDPMGYRAKFDDYKRVFDRFIGEAQVLIVTETLQVDDYAKYGMTMFDEAARRKRREEIFPLDCKRAFEAGAALART